MDGDRRGRRTHAGRAPTRCASSSCRAAANSNVEFDIELAKKTSLDNPVFYVQYGHARLCSILRKAASIGIALAVAARPHAATGRSSSTPTSSRIVHSLAEFPDVVVEAASGREPHRIVFYVQELAREFQSYFTRLKGERPDPAARLRAAREGLGGRLGLRQDATRASRGSRPSASSTPRRSICSGVTAPERMDRPKDDALAAETTDDEAAG